MDRLRTWAAAVIAVVVVAISLLALSHRLQGQPMPAAGGPLPGYCAYITPPPDVPWGGATVCTPWG